MGRVSSDISVVTVNSGKDGVINAYALAKATEAFVNILVGSSVGENGDVEFSEPGTVGAAIKAANKVLSGLKVDDTLVLSSGDEDRILQ